MNKNRQDSDIEELINSGSEIVGAATGGVLGFFSGGPVGAALGGAGGVVVAKGLSKLGLEVKQRFLGKREEVRIGATISYAIMRIQEKLSSGCSLRDDGFFNNETNNRSAADEIYEGVILAAQREHEEKKIMYYGNLLGNIAFNKEIDRAFANQLIQLSESLLYRQLCLLNVFFKSSKSKSVILRQTNFRDPSVKIPKELIPVLYEILDLYNRNLIVDPKAHVFGLTDVNPAGVDVHGLGIVLYQMMELSTIPSEDVSSLVYLLQQ